MFDEGAHIEKYPDNVIYALQHGMVVGNHSYSHPNFAEISFEKGSDMLPPLSLSLRESVEFFSVNTE